MTFHHSKQHEFLDVIMVSVRAIDLLPFAFNERTTNNRSDFNSKRFTLIHQVQPKYQKSSIISKGPTPTIQPTQQLPCPPSKLSSSASCWLRLQGPTAFGKTEADDGRGFHNECLYRGPPRGSHDGNSKKNPGNFVSSVHRIFGKYRDISDILISSQEQQATLYMHPITLSLYDSSSCPELEQRV